MAELKRNSVGGLEAPLKSIGVASRHPLFGVGTGRYVKADELDYIEGVIGQYCAGKGGSSHYQEPGAWVVESRQE